MLHSLFISRTIVQLHGGEISVSSTAGVGSTFSFYIAARRPPNDATPESPADDARLLIKRTRTASPLRQAGIMSSANGMISILVVEDNLVNQKIATRQLRSRGFVVHTANHGIEALEFLKMTDYWNDGLQDDKQSAKVALSLVLMGMSLWFIRTDRKGRATSHGRTC